MNGTQPMSDQISPEMFDHLVDLAALEMTPDQADYVRRQLNNQLRSIRELEAIPMEDDVPISSHGVPYTPQTSQPLRDDVWLPYEDPTAIIQQAPESADRFISVPDIHHTELD
jgi:aspartyl/glutamyl-tRNA(Asn/Gln) amidotransferase C subunit